MAFRAGSLLFLCCATAAQDPAKLAEEAKLTLAEAIDRGLGEAKKGTCFHAELEREDGVAAYSIDVAQGKRTCNVVLDAGDGRIRAKEIEDEDHSKQVAICKVTLKAAVAAALAVAPGTAVEARLFTVNNKKATVHVRVLVGGKIVRVQVDGATGEAKVHGPLPAGAARPFTDTFRVDPADWSPTGRNRYFVLEPGHVLVLEGGGEKLTITVLDETKVVDGVPTRVVEEREEKEGKLVEVSRNFLAMSKRTNDVYYFGEEVDIYKDGEVLSHEGAWLAGVNGARWGLLMPGTPLLGARYCQEIAPDVAMDRAEIVSVTATFETPAGKFDGCLETEESSALESGKERKLYAPGIGLIRDGKRRLVRHGTS